MSTAQPNGRKYTLTKAWLVMGSAVMLGSGVLAALGKLTGDWTTLASAFFATSAGVVASFSAANAYVTGKAADNKLTQGGTV